MRTNIFYIAAVTPVFAWGSGFFCVLAVILSVCQGVAFAESYEADVVQAAKAHDHQAEYALSLLYEYGGETIARDPDKAIFWLEKAGQGEVAGACLYLGLKYEYGNRVKKDLKKAVCWYACAAHKDWPAAQYFLAAMYEKGKGVAKSSENALLWFGLAAAYGYPGAEKEFSRLKEKTGFRDMASLRVAQDRLIQVEESYCN